MAEKNKKKLDEVNLQIKVNLALCCDKYVNGKDRICGYVVVKDSICVGGLNIDDINRFLKAGEIKSIEG